MKIKFESKNLLREKVSDIIRARKDIEFAYIFGSFALLERDPLNRNTFNDVDIAVYLSKDRIKNAFSFELEAEAELEENFHIPFDVRVINEAPLSFRFNVIKTGIVISDRNKSLRGDFEGLTLKEYFDFVHLRNEYLRGVINAPV